MPPSPGRPSTSGSRRCSRTPTTTPRSRTVGSWRSRPVGRPTFAGATAAITAQLAKDRLPTAGLSLADASGLSPDDRVTPQLLAAVLRAAATTRTAWRSILEGLPVAAFSGTLATRDLGPAGTAAAGVVRAKTGNIAGTTAVAGTVVDDSGRQLVFVFVTDDAQGLESSESALDALAAALVPL